MELKQAVALLALAMTSGEVLSGCGKAPPEPSTPNVVPERAAQGDANDLAALRRAAAVVDEWHHRDPAQTEGVLREHGLFACDETTTACIAAKHAADVALAPPEPAAPSVAPSAAPSTGVADIAVHSTRAGTRPARPRRDVRVPTTGATAAQEEDSFRNVMA